MSTPTNMLVIEGQKLEPCGPAGAGDSSVKVLNTAANCGAATAPLSKPESVSGPAPVLTGHGHQPISTTATVAAPGPQTSSPSVVVVAATPGGSTSTGQLQVTTPALSQLASVKQTATPGRTVVITVPRTAAPQPVAVAPRPHQTPSSQLPGHIQIPPGMMLIRSDSGQLMLVYQQALAQAPQGPRIVSGQAPRILAHQVSAAAGSKSNEKVTVIRMTPPPSFQSPPVQKTAVVKVIGVAPKPAVVQTPSALSEQENQPHILAAATQTKKEPQTIFSPETLESVKKCKNFLVTLIKLASSGSRSANMANNVRGLVRSLLEGKLEAEEFTEQLYHELKSTPQPCLVPFLKKSLPAVRRLTADPQLFIQQASTSSNKPNTQSSAVKQSLSDRGQNMKNSQQICQQPRQVILRPALTTLAQSRNYLSKSSRPSPKPTVLQSGSFPVKHPLAKDPPHSTKFGLKHSSGSYKEDDDINDVAFMAGVNLREENAQILTSVVGSVVQSCQDQPFLAPNSVLSRILHTGQALEVTDVSPEVVALVSHATQEYLRELLEKLTAIAELRKAALKEDLCYVKVSDVRSQLRFLEEVETLQKKKKDEEEREKMLRLARSRSHTEDPQHQQLKQRAKELQQMEEAELQQREANLTALAAIGPRRKRPLELTESQVPLLSRPGVNRVTRVMLKDLLVCMEQDPFLRHSLTLYKAML